MKISFDFDGTLENKKVQDVAKDLILQGYEVCILTTRYSDPSKYKMLWDESEAGREQLKKQHQELFDVAKEVGITEIHFTEYQWKYTCIDDFNIDVHLDDNFQDEVRVINGRCKAKAILYSLYKKWEDELYHAIGDKSQ